MAVLPGDDGPYVFASVVPSPGGAALVEYLAGRFTYRSREQWLERIRAGDVRIGGEDRPSPDRILVAGEALECIHRDYVEPEIPTDWRIVALGDDWLAVAKPSGMPVHSTPRIYRQSLVWQVRKLWGADWSPVHRIDRDTSGLVLFARGSRLLGWLNRAFEHRRVEKVYLARVHGRVDEAMVADGPIGSADDPEISVRQAVRSEGREARTEIRPIAPGPDCTTWILARPFQGRMHQIRVHCQSLGHPLVGDLLYDGREGEGYKRRAGADPSESPLERLQLHAYQLRFHPAPPGTLPDLLRCPSESFPFPGPM
ncbi:MAG TPA: RluA family pseudouridine synthase [Fibrobacteria bacterium]|nr:RluA family pseudouridine synthase [Fibrobacteria bacterium]HOX51667.1 RluA family pseudouridine synthase [Fibrobacteria bacterium]